MNEKTESISGEKKSSWTRGTAILFVILVSSLLFNCAFVMWGVYLLGKMAK
jgi:hypothetical protein